LREKQKGYEKEALRICERVKARVFVEMLATRDARGRSEPDQKVLSRDREFQVKLTALQKQVATLKLLGDKAPQGRKEEAEEELDEASKQYESSSKR
jgi:hypothetical protein